MGPRVSLPRNPDSTVTGVGSHSYWVTLESFGSDSHEIGMVIIHTHLKGLLRGCREAMS